ncbi:glycine receptor subunit alpha-2-like [Eriocheir sinensis]|uniref:glycine receptor subunit alpha-2-like n=1 Tax=Eriocheir sinensis TaxID=95602 RepID=UPI0021C7599F|nr:glycine receptor subunit alpha-2-like [Eriocheir sinensis]XP_050730982.1 glycine receptor subunit alpha-2-like [Eriocheir sinensis]
MFPRVFLLFVLLFCVPSLASAAASTQDVPPEYRSHGGVGNNDSADNGSSGGGSGGGVDGGDATGTYGATPAGGGGGERKAPAGGGEKVGARKGGSGGPRRYSIPSSELKKLDQLFVSEDDKMTYDRRQTPSYTAGSPTRVHIEMYIRSFGSINPIHMDYTVDLYLRQRWLELRFLNNSLTRPVDLNDPVLVKMLWKPEVYFPNAKESDFQYVTVPNVMLRIHPDGTILYILRLKLTFSCMMDLFSYPLDHQTCYIQIASFVKTTRELELTWYEDSPLKMYRRLKLPQFEMKEIKADVCNQSFHIGNYSCLQAVFELRRNIGYHLVQSYLPTSLIVVVSWVSFWLDVDAIPSRVTLGVTTLLTVCSESTSFRDKMPAVSYVKALDIWMGSCTAFVFLALVEFTVVNHIARHHRRFLFWGSVYWRSRLASSSQNQSLLQSKQGMPGVSSTKCSNIDSLYTCAQTSSFGGQDDNSKQCQKRLSNVTMIEAQPSNKRIIMPVDMAMEETVEVQSGGFLGGSQETALCSSDAAHCTGLGDYDLDEDEVIQSHNHGHSDAGLSCLPTLWKQEAVFAKRIDKTCRALFPAMFVVFNLIYWLYYQVFT